MDHEYLWDNELAAELASELVGRTITVRRMSTAIRNGHLRAVIQMQTDGLLHHLVESRDLEDWVARDCPA